MKKIITIMLIAVMSISTLAGCGSSSKGTVATDGSTSMEKVIGALGESFQNDTGISFTYNPTGSGIKYNNQGGFVKVSIYEDDRQVRVRVEDNGIGIPKEHHEKIFERFYRVDKSHSKQSGGTGLGLSIVKHAVLYHSGSIMIDSKPNEGTTIEAILSNR